MPEETNNNQTSKQPDRKLIWAPPVEKQGTQSDAPHSQPISQPIVAKKENLLSELASLSVDIPGEKPLESRILQESSVATPPEAGNLDALRARVTELSIETGSTHISDTTPEAIQKTPQRPRVSPMKPLEKISEATPPTPPISNIKTLEGDITFIEPKPEKKEILNESPEEARKRAQEEVKEELAVQKDEVARSVATPEPATKDSTVRPLRTYKDDLAQALQSKGTSYVGIVAAEERRRGERVTPNKKKKPFKIPPVLIALVSGFLLLGGISVLVYTFLIAETEVIVVPPEEVPAFIFTERQQGVDITDLDNRVLMNLLVNTTAGVSGGLGSIEQLYFTRLVPLLGSDEIAEELVPARTFIEQLDTHAPDTLLRTLNDEMTFGVHVFDGNEPFIILKTRFYENAFSGMLEWERYLNEDLSPLFGPIVEQEISTSTPFRNIPFKDRVLRNKETRVLEDTDSEVVLIYSFIDRQTIVITTNEHTFAEIISRLTAIRI